MLCSRLVGIPFAGECVVLAQLQAVMRPAQFVTQHVTNWEGMEKQPHVAEIGFVEPAAESAICVNKAAGDVAVRFILFTSRSD